MPKTLFRTEMEKLLQTRGNSSEWPVVLHDLLEGEYLCQRQQLGFAYAEGREVFKDRDNHDPNQARIPEKRAVYQFFHLCREQANGCLTIGETPYWLLGYEWPNQGSEKMMRADLVGLNLDGGLVVFECKLENNSYSPFSAILEGLDYLTCLTSSDNFTRVQNGFLNWRAKTDQILPEVFIKCQPNLEARQEVVVLAPSTYFDLYRRSGRGVGWEDFASTADAVGARLRLGFAVSDFTSPQTTWASIS